MPITLYHGTNNKADIVSKGFKLGDCSDFGKAIYFSNDIDVAKGYGKDVVECLFSGNMLDLSYPPHFELFKKYPNERITTIKYDALKDNYIIAVYNKKKIKIIN